MQIFKTELGFINAFADCCGFSLCTFLFVGNTICHFDTGRVEITFTIYIVFSLSLSHNRGTSSEPRPGKCLAFHIPAAALFAITYPITGVSVVQCLRPRQTSRAVN